MTALTSLIIMYYQVQQRTAPVDHMDTNLCGRQSTIISVGDGVHQLFFMCHNKGIIMNLNTPTANCPLWCGPLIGKPFKGYISGS